MPPAIDPGKSRLDLAIGSRIRMLRKMRSMSQPDLAAAIGLSFQQVQRYETGESSLSIPMLAKVSTALSVTPMDLLQAFLQETSEEPSDLFADLASPGASDLLKAYGLLDSKSRSHLLGIAQALAFSHAEVIRLARER
jgi:transcriptional regulator with XRE-family HTH domain